MPEQVGHDADKKQDNKTQMPEQVVHDTDKKQ